MLRAREPPAKFHQQVSHLRFAKIHQQSLCDEQNGSSRSRPHCIHPTVLSHRGADRSMFFGFVVELTA